MRYKHLKNADVDVSVIGVGTWSIGAGTYGDVEDQQSVAAIRAMIDNNVRFCTYFHWVQYIQNR